MVQLPNYSNIDSVDPNENNNIPSVMVQLLMFYGEKFSNDIVDVVTILDVTFDLFVQIRSSQSHFRFCSIHKLSEIPPCGFL